ncbi:MAG: MBL fold metallo-hydrolase [Coriobacteriales bacterium]|jgi:glyoxylase-like metal-dependent hydrolase (beta-lactamase superfamily II)|nr:MBL fold metallo-hydrolase [Coriobacteriales bacterium]
MMQIKRLEIAISHARGLVTNCYLVELPDGTVIVDPAEDAAQIISALGKNRPQAVILTHRHDDHLLAVPELVAHYGEQLPVYVHEADLAAAHDSIAVRLEPLHGGERLCGVFEVIHTPGHSSGSICLYVPDEGLLFSGDTLFEGTCGAVHFESGSPSQMHDSLQRLAKLPKATVVLPGHGNPTTIGEELTAGLVEI